MNSIPELEIWRFRELLPHSFIAFVVHSETPSFTLFPQVITEDTIPYTPEAQRSANQEVDFRKI